MKTLPWGVPAQPVLVLTEIEDYLLFVRGVFSSQREIEDYIDRFRNYEPQTGDRLLFKPLTDELSDPDKYATSEIVIVSPRDGSHERLDLFVWDSVKRMEAHAPLKLYWCSTEDDPDVFVVAHTGLDAARAHQSRDGFDSNAAFLMTLPPALQVQGDDLLGRPSREVLLACGARFVEGGAVELDGEIFTE